MELGQISRWIAMADAIKVKPAKAAEVQERVKSETCLCCESPAELRGVCDTHYRLFLRRMREQGNKEAQAEFEAKAIRNGLILPSGQMRTIKRTDPFSEL